MAPMHDHDAPDHLADRLREARDVAAFSHGRPGAGADARAAGPAGEALVERVTELTGDAHLGGRKVKDRFVRSGPAAPPAGAAGAASPPGLDPYLEARLKEVHDERPRFRSIAPELKAEAVDTYRELRRRLGGGS